MRIDFTDKKDNISVWFTVNYSNIMSLIVYMNKIVLLLRHSMGVSLSEFKKELIGHKIVWGGGGHLGSLTKFNPATFYCSACTKPGKWVVVYIS